MTLLAESVRQNGVLVNLLEVTTNALLGTLNGTYKGSPERGLDSPLGVPTPLEPPSPVTPLNPPKHSLVRRAAPDDHEFQKFWETYPKNHGSRKTALSRWLKLSDADRTDALIGAANYAKSPRALEGDLAYVKHAEAWLNGRFWETWQDVMPANGNGHKPHEPEIRFGPQGEKYIDGVLAPA